MSNPVEMNRTQPQPRTVRLSELREGARGRLFSTDLCCEDCQMLNAMGLTDQCEIRVCQRSSPGKPCIVQVHATRLGLSASLAENIFVCMGTEPEPA